ncbi:hypothetical protein VC83_08606 [Pseudogymnoascus destructans]|uniref:Yeast cell wall synthesis Kre9/Knh1-like N-terminal domain-containing protein n=2 Tax=Pseudogymnoascus destructans TaxID=655981 RepID=L8G369_PSED2|nr:uncharacterized protein VC83_08606 [Pseudogymnoascus destructans]ELR06436.1 hypothetical protein GMDG_07961 [Pseudogymnoascus destructans 20631-21]OAF54830.1 hypothetical protein VC83_08606 [Pseudogymnoascus destructans]
MRFISALLAGALAVVAAAQTGTQPNPFTNTDFTGIAAGKPITITWTPTTNGKVKLELVHSDTGNSDDLKPVSTIQASIPNSGSFTWTPSSSIVNGEGYALKIVNDANPDEYNYTLQFPIKTDTDAAAPTSASSTAASSSTAVPSSTAKPSTSTTEQSSTTSEVTSTGASSTTKASTTAASTTKSAPATTSHAAATSSSMGAAATGGAKVGAGLMGFVGAAMLLL